MELSKGDRLGVYEITERIGAGGMGVVYRARDPRVGRDVAIKVSSRPFTRHFEREARAIASLNHPNICTLYDVGPDYLVMELVAGVSPCGPQPLPGLFDVARQLAAGLAAAHERGIVHGDLKPGNIKVTPAGLVKVLDFGLAATLPSDPDGGAASLPETETLPPVGSTTLLGTAAYMSPERIRDEPVSKRADIWAYGVVLYELLTGRRPFRGDAVGDVLTAIVHRNPDWTELPASTPPELLRLLRRCLEKDPKKRLPDMAMAPLEIDDAISAPAAARPVRRSTRWLVAGALGIAVAGGTAGWLVPRPRQDIATLAVTRFTETSLDVPLGESPALAVSPDGRRIVYATGRGLYLRALSDPSARPIPGTATDIGTSHPAFSPDGQSIAYFEGATATKGAIKTVAVTGGTPRALKRLAYPPYGISWTAAGILFARSLDKDGNGIVQLAPDGGSERMLIASGDEFVQGPQLLPDGDTILFTLANGLGPDRWDNARILMQSLTSGTRTTIVEGGADARYLPTGHILYARGNALFTVPFDPRRPRAGGVPIQVLEGVRRSTPVVSGDAQFAVSSGGTLVYQATQPLVYELALIGRDGSVRAVGKPPGSYRYPRISPDGKRFVVETRDNDESTIWVGDFDAGHALRRLTFGGHERFPLWSPDGTFVVFQAGRDAAGGLYRQRADGLGSPARLTTSEPGSSHEPESWSPDGDTLLFRVERGSQYALWAYSLAERRGAKIGGIESGIPPSATFSPDGKWVAYESREADKFLLFVQRFPLDGTRYQVVDAGIFPSWAPDGRSLFYFHGNSMFTQVNITFDPVFSAAPPADLWPNAPRHAMMTGPEPHRSYDPMKDGRFLSLIPASTSAATPPSPQIILNWFEELKRRP